MSSPSKRPTSILPGESNEQQASRQSQILPQGIPGLRLPSNRKTIYDRHLNRSRNGDLSRASFAYLFAEMVTYAQRRVTGIQDLEKRCVLQSERQTGTFLRAGDFSAYH